MTEHLSVAAAYAFLDTLPDRVNGAIIAYAAEKDYSIEAVLEMAIAQFLSSGLLNFADCIPLSLRSLFHKRDRRDEVKSLYGLKFYRTNFESRTLKRCLR